MNISPVTKQKWHRFTSIKRGYWSFIIMSTLILLSCFAELLVNNRALIVSYDDNLYFPTYGDQYPGTTFGQDYAYETNYRELKKQFQLADNNNWVLLPPVPWGAYENDLDSDEYPPTAPSIDSAHYLGTDTTGRDVVARLVYGFRISIWFSISLLVATYLIGISLGLMMGFKGGWFDLLIHRFIEIWGNVPFLYLIMIISSIVVPNFWLLIAIMVSFGWMGITLYMRTTSYRENAREYVMAARALGASNSRIIFHHILPNAVSIIITFIPFTITGGIGALTALDYLGFGLPAPTPSWGELLRQGTDNLDEASWIATSVIVSLVIVLTLITFIGEAIREAFDPKKHTTYQ